MRRLALLAFLPLAGCGFSLEEGTYRFAFLGLEEDTCGRAELIPETWEGIIVQHSRVIQMKLADPFFLAAVGGQSLVGRGFPDRDPEAFLVDASYPAVVPLADVDCPSFLHQQMDAVLTGERSFTGRMAQVVLVDPQAPAACPVQCVTAFRFEARRLSGNTELP